MARAKERISLFGTLRTLSKHPFKLSFQNIFMRLLAFSITFLILIGSVVLATPIDTEAGQGNNLWNEIWTQRESYVGQNNIRLTLRGIEKLSVFNPGFSLMFSDSSFLRKINPELADEVTALKISMFTGINFDTQRGTVGTSIGDMALNLLVVGGAIGMAGRIGGALTRAGSTISRALRLGQIGAKLGARFPSLAKLAEKASRLRTLAAIKFNRRAKIVVRDPNSFWGKLFKLRPKNAQPNTGRIIAINKPHGRLGWHFNTESARRGLKAIDHVAVKTVVKATAIGGAYITRTVQRARSAVSRYTSSIHSSIRSTVSSVRSTVSGTISTVRSVVGSVTRAVSSSVSRAVSSICRSISSFFRR